MAPLGRGGGGGRGDLAGTGAVTGPGLPSSKWQSRPAVFTTEGEIQTFLWVAEWAQGTSGPSHTQHPPPCPQNSFPGLPACAPPLGALLLSGAPVSAHAWFQLFPSYSSFKTQWVPPLWRVFPLSTGECKGALARFYTVPCAATFSSFP